MTDHGMILELAGTGETRRNALTGAPRALCTTCDAEIALVDRKERRTTRKSRERGWRSPGQWVHVALPVHVHPARPKGH